MPVRLLSLPFVIAALYFLYLTWEFDEGYALYIIPPVIALALLYVLSPQINWWWYKRNPPALDPPLRTLLERFYSFYQHLEPGRQKRFRDRMTLYMMGVEFMPQAVESVPEDIKGIIAASAVTLTFGMDDEQAWRLPAYERVVMYPKAFPSPQFPEHFHGSEHFEEDGVFLFSAEHLMLGFTQPTQYLNLGLYEYARVFARQEAGRSWPTLPADIWEKLQTISGFEREKVLAWINLPEEEIDVGSLTVTHFLLYPRAFHMALPDLYHTYQEIFGFDPGGTATA